jgi:hypothetical protein
VHLLGDDLAPTLTERARQTEHEVGDAEPILRRGAASAVPLNAKLPFAWNGPSHSGTAGPTSLRTKAVRAANPVEVFGNLRRRRDEDAWNRRPPHPLVTFRL